MNNPIGVVFLLILLFVLLKVYELHKVVKGLDDEQ